MEFEFDATELAKMARQYEGGPAIVKQELRKGLARAGQIVRNAAVRLVRVKTGRLRSSLAVDPVRDQGGVLSVTVGTNVQYAPDLEFGTGPRVIEPVRKRALYWEGAAHPVRRVNHPGTKPYPFLRPALQQSGPRISQTMQDAARAAFARITAGGR